MKQPSNDRGTRRTAAKGLAAIGLVSGLSLVSEKTADAGIVYSGPKNIEVDSTSPSYNLDVNGDSVTDYTINWNLPVAGVSSDVTFSSPGISGGAVNNAVVIDGSFAAALDSGMSITGASTFGGGTQTLGTDNYESKSPVTTGPFPNQHDKYLGLRFDIAGQWHYGWALLDVVATGGTGQTVTIKGWAYDDEAGASIVAGNTSSPISSVPEPASLLQLAMGAVGLAAIPSIRRRQARAAGGR